MLLLAENMGKWKMVKWKFWVNLLNKNFMFRKLRISTSLLRYLWVETPESHLYIIFQFEFMKISSAFRRYVVFKKGNKKN